jgi:DNA repair photolyase
MFHRRKKGDLPFTHLEGNREDLFENWIKRTLAKEYDYTKGDEVAFKERIPLKMGATSDPFPFSESKDRITYNFLKLLHAYDYPLEIQTKNPEILAEYASDFENPNWAIAVTLITTDEAFLKVCEPRAISAERRLKAIKKLTEQGLKVMVKIQPAIHPKIAEDLPELVRDIKDAGCWAFNTEGLKLRISMTKEEQLLFKSISSYLNHDLRKYYKHYGENTGSDWELSKPQKVEYTELAIELAEKYELKYYTADNLLGKFGCSAECCGTEVLRDYKIWGGSIRSSYFEPVSHCSTELGKCLDNFIRKKALTKNWQTLNEVMEEEMLKLNRRQSILEVGIYAENKNI